MRAGQAVIELLKIEQVRHVFGIVGWTLRDVLNDQTVTAELGEPSSYRPLYASQPSPEAIADAVSVLRTSRRPLMLVGGGVTWAGANDLVRQLSADFGWPTITAYGRNDAVPNDDPLYVGPPGRAGSPEAAAACRRADVP